MANKFLKAIDNKIKILETFPFAYELYKKEENFEYRKLIVKNYIIIYKINLKDKKIKVLHIYNQKFNYNKKSILL
ncbi:MAG: type II toxin-antitoxin system RelE/ParE family toxin [Clostridia bacterium]|nr:type II toxin-antitoxin system RelE/ParE family toxin [Clostridia bacterium]